METKPLVLERTLDAPASKIWQALTDAKKMKEWYFDVPNFKPEVGLEFEFTAGETGGKQYRHLCKITEVIPEKKLSYSWRYDGYPGNSEVSFELAPDGNGTKLTITHKGLETFPQDNGSFKRESFNEGWTYFLTKGLPEYLAKN